MTRGLERRGLQPPFGVAEERHHLVADDLDDFLRRTEAAAQDVLVRDRVHGAVADAIDERLDDLEVDVRFEQREPNFAQRDLDVLRRQSGLAPKRRENVLKSCAEGLEHVPLTRSTANPYRSGRARACQTDDGGYLAPSSMRSAFSLPMAFFSATEAGFIAVSPAASPSNSA